MTKTTQNQECESQSSPLSVISPTVVEHSKETTSRETVFKETDSNETDSKEMGSKRTTPTAKASSKISNTTVPDAKHSRKPSKDMTEEYIKISEQLSNSLKLNEIVPKKQLLILDLNGTLVSRNGKTAMFVRPYQDQFIEYIFAHFKVMVWSSARPPSVNFMCRIFGDRVNDLVRIWDRTSFNLSPEEYSKKTVTIKDLQLVWDDLGDYNATNTILLDDSPVKTVRQPYNSIHIREFNHKSETFQLHGERELLDVIEYLKVLQTKNNVCSYMRQHPYKSRDPESTPYLESNFQSYHYTINDHPKKRNLESFERKRPIVPRLK